MNSNKALWTGVVVAIVIAIIGLYTPARDAAVNVVGSVGTRFPNGLAVGTTATVTQNKITIGNSGTALAGVNFGTCTIFASTLTIAASSTAMVECQAGASALSALTGITDGDTVFVTPATTTSTLSGGIAVVASNASTTSGYIALRISNLTGATFTWTATASSSWRYAAFR